MVWVRVDDGAMHHEKLLAAGPDAICLWLAGLCYANRHTTNGALARGVLLALYPSETLPAARAKKAAARLVEVELWDATEAGWRIRNYERYQKEAMSETRDRRREADKLSKQEKRGTKSTADPPTVGALSESDTTPTPSRPASDPTQIGTESAPSRARDPGPIRPDPARSGPHTRAARDASGEVRVSKPDPDRRSSARDFEASMRPPSSSKRDIEHLVARTLCERYREHTGKPWHDVEQLIEAVDGGGLRALRGAGEQVRGIAAWCSASELPETALEQLLVAFFANAWAAENGYPVAALAKEPARFVAARRAVQPSPEASFVPGDVSAFERMMAEGGPR